MNRAILTAHQAGHVPDTLRFVRFRPAALLGFHQDAERELHLEFLRQRGIHVQRRITGGGAIYMGPEQLGWELYLGRRSLGGAGMDALAARICGAAVDGLRRLGVAACFRPRNDIEVEGRKLSGTGGAFDGDSVLYQGTLLVGLDLENMLGALRVPAEKLAARGLSSLRQRVVSLAELLGTPPPLERVKEVLAAAFARGLGGRLRVAADLAEAERQAFREALREIDSPAWVYRHSGPAPRLPVTGGAHRCSGGTIRVAVVVDAQRQRLLRVWFSGDFFVSPASAVTELEVALRDVPLTGLGQRLREFFGERPVHTLNLKPADFAAALRQALPEGCGV